MKKFLMVMVLGLVLCGCEKDVQDDVNKDNNENNVVSEQVVTELYNKYIKYSEFDVNAYTDINVNESNSDEYMVKVAIHNILKDNNVNIEDYPYGNEYNDYSDGWKNGYKITTSQIDNYISELFNVNKTINYGELSLGFNADISAYYFINNNAYRLIQDSSIPKTGWNFGVYSKYLNSEVNGDNIIIYSDYFLLWESVGTIAVEDKVNDEEYYSVCYYDGPDVFVCPEDYDTLSIEGNFDYILNNLSDQVGKFKHTFTKGSDGNYYWVSTNKIN